MSIVLVAVLGYAIGSLPIVYFMARVRGVNLRAAGTGNLGVGNLWAQTDRWTGVSGALVDFAKGPAAVLVARTLDLGVGAEAASAIGVVSGQMWPFALAFNGGRGNITAGGALMALAPVIGAFSWIGVVAFTAPKLTSVMSRRSHIARNASRSTPIASLAGLVTFTILAGAFGEAWWAVAGASITGLILIRRVTAPWPPDQMTGQRPPRSFTGALLFDRPFQPATDRPAPIADGERV